MNFHSHTNDFNINSGAQNHSLGYYHKLASTWKINTPPSISHLKHKGSFYKWIIVTQIFRKFSQWQGYLGVETEETLRQNDKMLQCLEKVLRLKPKIFPLIGLKNDLLLKTSIINQAINYDSFLLARGKFGILRNQLI